MALQWKAPDYIDGDHTVAASIGTPEFSSPIASTSAQYLFIEPFHQLLINFRRTPLNVVHWSAGLTPDYSNYFLVREFDKRDFGGGIVQFKRMYALKPSSHNEGESHDYQFIGFVGVWLSTSSSGFVNNVPPSLVTTVSGRPRESRIVNSRLQFDYFLVDGQSKGAWSSGTAYVVDDGVSDSGVYYKCILPVGPVATHPVSDSSHWSVAATPDYSSELNIPVVYAQRYFSGPASLASYVQGVATGLYANFLTDGVGSLAATSPGITDYQSWISNGLSLGWTSDPVGNWRGGWSSSGTYAVGDGVSYSSVNYKCTVGVGPTATNPSGDGSHWSVYHPGQIVAEDSTMKRWFGNIWVRTIRYVLAL